MNELPALGRPRRPGSKPRPDVLQAVVATGRRRLRRAALGGAGALTTVAAMVLGVGMLGGSGTDGLVVVPASPEPEVSPVATPTPGEASPPPDRSASAPGPARPAPEPQPAGRPSSSAAPQGDAPGDEPRTAAGQGSLPEHRERPTRRERSGDLCQGSRATWAPEGYRVCMAVQMSTSVAQYSPVSIELELCSSLSSPGHLRLAFPTGREHEVQVRPQDELDDYRWTWSRHYRFTQGAHELALAPGECLSWVTQWDTRNDAGQVLPPGEYYVEAVVAAEGASQVVQQLFRVTAE